MKGALDSISRALQATRKLDREAVADGLLVDMPVSEASLATLRAHFYG